ncbi:MAG: hypothetical protein ACLQIB_17895, partial [Isosphaeraceae bacterium]
MSSQVEYYEKEPYSFCKRFFRGYDCLVEWFPKHLGPPRESASDDTETTSSGETAGGGGYASEDAPRRVPPNPWDSPPFPTSEWQGYPLIGIPPNPAVHPLMEA